MALMAAAAAAVILAAGHDQFEIQSGGDGLGQRLPETRPARAAVVLGGGAEQGQITTGAVEGALALLAVEWAGEGWFGSFHCAGCDLPLFSSATKYDSGTGWPSFWQPLPQAIATKLDFKLIVPRREYHCRRCGGHQGHVFGDGPRPTGQRYCNNGVALRFSTGQAADNRRS